MPRHLRLRLVLTVCVVLAGPLLGSVRGQQPAPRVFAPGVETVIPPELDPTETTTQHDVVEIRAERDLDWSPELLNRERTLFNQAESARFNRDIWGLEFGFKPLRMIRLESADRPQQLIWYLVYRVKNTGAALAPQESEQSGGFSVEEASSGPVRFVPHFVLEGQDVAPEGGRIFRAYLDEVIPGAVEAIRQRETPGRTLLSSVEMPLEPLAVGEERWGVAMWRDLDPEMDFFSVFVRGLTNAYQWTDPQGLFAAGDPPGTGRQFVQKTLQLNFWRPGDRFLQHESEVRYGVPPGKAGLYGVAEGVAHRWVYR